ncbi:MAG: hypothetical protein JST63_02610 [Bacteroidetes bacterium]|nr:hypothetical protein [Bacteroidota bacterium]
MRNYSFWGELFIAVVTGFMKSNFAAHNVAVCSIFSLSCRSICGQQIRERYLLTNPTKTSTWKQRKDIYFPIQKIVNPYLSGLSEDWATNSQQQPIKQGKTLHKEKKNLC